MREGMHRYCQSYNVSMINVPDSAGLAVGSARGTSVCRNLILANRIISLKSHRRIPKID